jgi:hypothetical protein
MMEKAKGKILRKETKGKKEKKERDFKKGERGYKKKERHSKKGKDTAQSTSHLVPL